MIVMSRDEVTMMIKEIVNESIEDLKSRFGKVELDISDMKKDFTDLKKDVAVLKVDVADLKVDVADLKPQKEEEKANEEPLANHED